MIKGLFKLLWLYSALLGIVAVYVAWKFNWPPQNGRDWIYLVLLAAVGAGLAFLSVWEFIGARKSIRITAEGIRLNGRDNIPWMMIRDVLVRNKKPLQAMEPPEILLFRFDTEQPTIYKLDERDEPMTVILEQLRKAAPEHIQVRMQD